MSCEKGRALVDGTQAQTSFYADRKQSIVNGMHGLDAPALTYPTTVQPEDIKDVAEAEYSKIMKSIDAVFKHDLGQHRNCRLRGSWPDSL